MTQCWPPISPITRPFGWRLKATETDRLFEGVRVVHLPIDQEGPLLCLRQVREAEDRDLRRHHGALACCRAVRGRESKEGPRRGPEPRRSPASGSAGS